MAVESKPLKRIVSIKKGDRVKVVARGTFYGCTGAVSRVTKTTRISRVSYWVILDNHAWQRKLPGADWGFDERELEVAFDR